MIGLTDLRPGFGGGEGNDRSSELLGTGDLFCGVGGGGGRGGGGRVGGDGYHQKFQLF